MRKSAGGIKHNIECAYRSDPRMEEVDTRIYTTVYKERFNLKGSSDLDNPYAYVQLWSTNVI